MNKLFFILCAIELLFYSNSWAQEFNYTGPNSEALANIRTIDHTVWSVQNNASSTAFFKHPTAAASYGMRYNLKELSTRAIIFLYPNKLGSFSALINQNGYSKSQTTKYGLSYSRSFGNNYAAFLQFNYISHHITGSHIGKGFYTSLGMLIKATESVQLGIYVQNPEQSRITYETEHFSLPSYFNVGLEWSAGSSIRVFSEIEKRLDYNPNYKVAVQFGLKERLFIRSGINGKPTQFTFGAGFILRQLQIDAGFSYHQQLGISSSVGISYAFYKKSE